MVNIVQVLTRFRGLVFSTLLATGMLTPALSHAGIMLVCPLDGRCSYYIQAYFDASLYDGERDYLALFGQILIFPFVFLDADHGALSIDRQALEKQGFSNNEIQQFANDVEALESYMERLKSDTTVPNGEKPELVQAFFNSHVSPASKEILGMN